MPWPKGQSRLQRTTQAKSFAKHQDYAFRRDVWDRDQGKCRMCRRPVKQTLARIQNRGEVHHLQGRLGAFRFDPNFAILVCAGCHEKLTGRVNERWIVQGCPDAREPLHFERIA